MLETNTPASPQEKHLNILGHIEYGRWSKTPGVTIHDDGVIEVPVDDTADYDKLWRISNYLTDQFNATDALDQPSRKYFRNGGIVLRAVLEGEVITEPTRETIFKLIDQHNAEFYD